MRRTPIIATVALAATVGLLSGCATGTTSVGAGGTHAVTAADTSSASPRAELAAAIAALRRGSTLTTTAGLAASPTAVSAAAVQLGHPLTTAQAAALAGLRLRVETAAPTGNTIAGLRGHRAELSRAVTVASGTTSYLQLVKAHSTFYLRGDLRAALVLTGHAALWRHLHAREARLPAFARALAHGRWISLPTATARLILNAVRQRIALPTGQQVRALLAGVRATVARDVTVTRAGRSGATDHLLLTASAATLSRDLLAVVRRDLPGLASRLAARHPTAPTGTLRVRATITRGVLTGLSTNLARLDPALSAPLPFGIHFRRSGPPISPPAHATPVTVSGLLDLAGLLRAGAAR